MRILSTRNFILHHHTSDPFDTEWLMKIWSGKVYTLSLPQEATKYQYQNGLQETLDYAFYKTGINSLHKEACRKCCVPPFGLQEENNLFNRDKLTEHIRHKLPSIRTKTEALSLSDSSIKACMY